jgi:hypothetical protein
MAVATALIGLAFPVIQYIAAQASLFGGVNLTPEYRFEVTLKVTKCAVGQRCCARPGEPGLRQNGREHARARRLAGLHPLG